MFSLIMEAVHELCFDWPSGLGEKDICTLYKVDVWTPDDRYTLSSLGEPLVHMFNSYMYTYTYKYSKANSYHNSYHSKNYYHSNFPSNFPGIYKRKKKLTRGPMVL